MRSACVEVFAGQAKQTWPPDVTVYRSWEPGYRALAEETGFCVLDIAEAADEVRQMIIRIEDARSPSGL